MIVPSSFDGHNWDYGGKDHYSFQRNSRHNEASTFYDYNVALQGR